MIEPIVLLQLTTFFMHVFLINIHQIKIIKINELGSLGKLLKKKFQIPFPLF